MKIDCNCSVCTAYMLGYEQATAGKTLREIEDELFRSILEKTNGSTSKTAEILGISVRSAQYWKKRISCPVCIDPSSNELHTCGLATSFAAEADTMVSTPNAIRNRGADDGKEETTTDRTLLR